MKKLKILGLTLPLSFILFLGLTMPGFAKTEISKAKLPVLTTSAGQSPDVTTVNIVLEEAGIKYDYCDVPDVEIVDAGVGLAGKESGPGFHVEVNTDGNKDGRFDSIAKEKGIPLTQVEYALDLVDIFKQVFK